VVLGAVACTIVADIARQSQSQARDLFRVRGYRAWLQLSANDDYASTIRKLGPPAVVSILRGRRPDVSGVGPILRAVMRWFS